MQVAFGLAHLARDVDGGIPPRVGERDPNQGNREATDLERGVRLADVVTRQLNDLGIAQGLDLFFFTAGLVINGFQELSQLYDG